MREFLDLLILKIEGRSINSSAINRSAVRTADLKIAFLKFYLFVLLAFICTCMNLKYENLKGKTQEAIRECKSKHKFANLLPIIPLL